MLKAFLQPPNALPSWPAAATPAPMPDLLISLTLVFVACLVLAVGIWIFLDLWREI